MPDRKQGSIEDLLAKYADQVIGSEDASLLPLSEDSDLKELQETVLQLNQLAPSPAPSESAEKIKHNLQLAWEKQQQSKPSIIARITRKFKTSGTAKGYQSAARRRQQMVLRISAAAVVVLILAVILMPGLTLTGGAVSGTASGTLNSSIFSIALLFIGAVGLWWWIKSRRD